MDFNKYINNYNININNDVNDIVNDIIISMRKNNLFFINFFKKYSTKINIELLEIISLIEIGYYILNLFLTISNIDNNYNDVIQKYNHTKIHLVILMINSYCFKRIYSISNSSFDSSNILITNNFINNIINHQNISSELNHIKITYINNAFDFIIKNSKINININIEEFKCYYIKFI